MTSDDFDDARRVATDLARQKRASLIEKIRDDLPNESARSSLDYVVMLSDIAKTKLNQAIEKQDGSIYSEWFDSYVNPIRIAFEGDMGVIKRRFSENKLPIIDLMGVDLSDKDLSKKSDDGIYAYDFRSTDLTGADFRRSNLSGVLTQPGTLMEYADFKDAIISEPANLEGASLNYSRLENAVMDKPL